MNEKNLIFHLIKGDRNKYEGREFSGLDVNF